MAEAVTFGTLAGYFGTSHQGHVLRETDGAEWKISAVFPGARASGVQSLQLTETLGSRGSLYVADPSSAIIFQTSALPMKSRPG